MSLDASISDHYYNKKENSLQQTSAKLIASTSTISTPQTDRTFKEQDQAWTKTIDKAAASTQATAPTRVSRPSSLTLSNNSNSSRINSSNSRSQLILRLRKHLKSCQLNALPPAFNYRASSLYFNKQRSRV